MGMRQNMFPTQQQLLQQANLARMQAQRQATQPVSNFNNLQGFLRDRIFDDQTILQSLIFYLGAKSFPSDGLGAKTVLVNCARGKEPVERIGPREYVHRVPTLSQAHQTSIPLSASHEVKFSRPKLFL